MKSELCVLHIMHSKHISISTTHYSENNILIHFNIIFFVIDFCHFVDIFLHEILCDFVDFFSRHLVCLFVLLNMMIGSSDFLLLAENSN